VEFVAAAIHQSMWTRSTTVNNVVFLYARGVAVFGEVMFFAVGARYFSLLPVFLRGAMMGNSQPKSKDDFLTDPLKRFLELMDVCKDLDIHKLEPVSTLLAQLALTPDHEGLYSILVEHMRKAIIRDKFNDSPFKAPPED